MSSVATKDSFIATENGQDTTQVSFDKCCFDATKFSTWDQLKEAFLSRQEKLCCDITFRVYNKVQQNFVKAKIFLSQQTKHEVEVNSVATRNSLSQ